MSQATHMAGPAQPEIIFSDLTQGMVIDAPLHRGELQNLR